MKPGDAVVGLAAHSGWAAAVVLGGSPAAPRVLGRTRVEMADPDAPDSKQPYHAVEGAPLAEAARRLDVYLARATAMADAAIRALARELAAGGHTLAAAGILESAGRKGASLAATLASHALIHTADGDHFRAALAAAAQRNGLGVTRVPVRELEARAEARLGGPASRLHATVKELGRDVGPPWGADQKAAALLAWMLLEQLTATRAD